MNLPLLKKSKLIHLVQERIGSTGNQFALMTIIGFLTSVPLMLYKEGAMMGEFFDLFMNNKEVFNNTVLSGLTFCMT